MPVYLELFHGRHSPDENIDGWGFEGPVLGPFAYVHTTYACDIKLEEIDETKIMPANLIVVEDSVQYAGAYYGDWAVATATAANRMRKRINQTRKILSMRPEQMPLLLSGETEWIKLYAEWKMKQEETKCQKPLAAQ
jgi:hypothetical protein